MKVWTDGSRIGTGEGGWGWISEDRRRASGYAPNTTNQRMELWAVLEAVRAHPEPGLVIVSDSAYVVNCFRDQWWRGWRAKGWKNSQRKPVANRDIWEPLIDLVLAHPGVTFEKVRGHTGDPMNEEADRLATEAARLF